MHNDLLNYLSAFFLICFHKKLPDKFYVFINY